MRRTYRSKKDTGGALDHKDVLLTLDERSSAFDAYYIQKLKQTKRELSCVGSSNQYAAATHKGRKKKFVKRIVKDVEITPGESMARSTYLTPDKSIRVNKGQDLFDQLLRTPRRLETKKRDDLFDQIRSARQTKTYGTKKAKKVRKYNYYSSESYETDKENETTNISTNVTDIRAHKLIVEKDIPHSPKYQDESINKIVQNLSIFNTMKNSNNSSDSPVISFSNQIRKGTKSSNQQLQSTVLDKSVLSSTPFKNIRTATSIYKLSPISGMSWEASPNCVTVTEENDQNLIDDLKSSSDKKPLKKVCDADKIDLSENSVMDNNKTEQVLQDQNVVEIKGSREEENLNCVSVLSDSFNESDMNISLGGSKPSELFLGFTKVEDQTHECVTIDISEIDKDDSRDATSNSIDCSELELSLGGSKPSFCFTNNSQSSDKNSKTRISNTSIDSGEAASLYDTCCSDKFAELSNELNKEAVINVTRMDDEVFQDYFQKMTAYKSRLSGDEEIAKLAEPSNELNKEAVINVTRMDDEVLLDYFHKMTTYKSGLSGDKEIAKFAEPSNELNKEAVINVTRMDDEVFQDYIKKMKAYASDLSGDEEMDENSETSGSQENNLSNSDNDYIQSKKLHIQVRNSDMIDNIVEVDSDDFSNSDEHCNTISDSSNSEIDEDTVSPQETESESEASMSDNFESNSNDDDEVRCFVNMRRKVTIKTHSNTSSLNDSSSVSSECNKTVLSNHKINLNSPTNEKTDHKLLLSNEVSINNGKCVKDDINNIQKNEIVLDSDEGDEIKAVNTRVSFVTTRKSSKRFSTKPCSLECAMDKPAIVLQPGKKWERSLSIYRRVTMMNDHFDKSVLEEEALNCKGRKYRQSVISTMEMQEGSLHNESISSRRSTFVARPCRSTISILKEPSNSRISLFNNTVYDDLKGFLSDDCDDTIVELTKLSIADCDHEVTVVEKLHEDRLTTAKDYVLRRCNQTDAILFDECYPDTALKNCHKIGEGVYGEVFLWRARDGRARVMKIVPVAGTTKVNGENQKDFHEIISEIVIAMELSALRTPIAELERQFDEGKKDIDTLDLHAIQNATDIFNEVLAVRCVYGSYTSRLLDLWELYDECKGSENDNPAILPTDQQYIVLELANAGQDLESYQFNSAEQAHALFLQVAFGLAVGEESFQFEHRDLHWGNVLIAPTEQKSATFVLRGRSHLVPRCGVAATIIDYSLSRLSLPLSGAGEAAALYNDLSADDGLFDAVGDYQFEVYRLMRDKLGNDWKNFEPYTNILWLHYTVDKMITALRYKRTNTKIHKHYIAKLKAIKNRILSYGSAVQFVLTDNEY